MAQITKELVTLVQVLREDDDLRGKFVQFAKLPPTARAAALSQLVGCMKAGKEETKFLRAISALKKPEMFDAVAKTLRELEE